MTITVDIEFEIQGGDDECVVEMEVVETTRRTFYYIDGHSVDINLTAKEIYYIERLLTEEAADDFDETKWENEREWAA